MPGKGQLSFQYQRRPMLKNIQTTAQLHSFVGGWWPAVYGVKRVGHHWVTNTQRRKTETQRATCSKSHDWWVVKGSSHRLSDPSSRPHSKSAQLTKHWQRFDSRVYGGSCQGFLLLPLLPNSAYLGPGQLPKKWGMTYCALWERRVFSKSAHISYP